MGDGFQGRKWLSAIGRPQILGRRPRRSYSATGLEALEERWMMSASGSRIPHGAVSDAVDMEAHVSTRSQSHGGGHSVTALARSSRGKALDPTVAGAWTPSLSFRPPGAVGPYVAIHMTLLPNGMVLAWPHDYNYFLKNKHAAPYTPDIMLWDPATNQYQHLTLLTDNIFCSGSTFLPDGNLMILGGHGPAAVPVAGLQNAYGNRHAEIYDYHQNQWISSQDMQAGRYYGSAITLGTGEVLTVAGFTEDGGNNPLIEIFKQGQGWRVLPGATTKYFPDWYPHIYQLSNGLVFGANPGKNTFFIDPSGDGRIWQGPSMNYPRRYYGSSVMYAQDKILSVGGNAAPGRAGVGGNNLITRTAETINLDAPNPTWQYTGSMKFPRLFPNATLLPDGTVLVTGGTSQQDNPQGNALQGAVYAAELWDPNTGQFTETSSMKVPRLYHSTAILLPDARVLVAGGGDPESTGERKGTVHQNMQIFSPPYLFKGPQPVISSAPSTAKYGQTISVSSPDAASITKVNLVRPGSVTHFFNMTQKIVSVDFTHAPDGTLQLHMPTNPNNAPPGPYMVFLLNSNGVPSKASMISLSS